MPSDHNTPWGRRTPDGTGAQPAAGRQKSPDPVNPPAAPHPPAQSPAAHGRAPSDRTRAPSEPQSGAAASKPSNPLGGSGTWAAVPANADGADPLTSTGDLLTASKVEYEQVGRELDEIRLLIKQSTAELEKLNQRKVLAAAKTREMEEKIETYSRQEIRASYLAASEAEMRAFMMGEQREQLQAKEKAFERYQRFLRHTIDLMAALQSAPPGPAPSMSDAATQRPAGAAPASPAPDASTAALTRAIQSQEDVRKRVAQRLHDGPAQALANVVLTAEICEKLIQSDPRRAQGELGNLKGQVNAALQDTRKFIFELRPMTLDDLGLVPTLRRYVADLSAKYQVQIALAAPYGEQRLPKEIETPIFRVAQEALSNTVQHSRATQVRVTITLAPDGVILTVEDNGTGFDVERALARAAAHQTLGIASMQERAEVLGGWLRIESAYGHGSRVELRAPSS